MYKLILLILFVTVTANNSCRSRTNICNGNGAAYIDNDCICECFNCWYGKRCQHFNESCTIDLARAQPYLQWECWTDVQGNEKPEIHLAGGYRTPYNFGTRGRPNFPGINLYIDLIRELGIFHSQPWVNNLNTTGKILVLGNGATHLNVAAVFAVAQQMKQQGVENIYHFSEIPAYDSIPFPSRYCEGIGANYCQTNFSRDLNASEVIEWIVNPNNPDNKIRDPVYPTARHIHDSVYHFPWSTATSVTPRDVDITIYSLSKTTGHSGSRFGWAWVKDPQIASLMTSYVGATSSFAPATEAVYRGLEIIKFMNTGDNGERYADCVREKLHQRWDDVLEILDGNTEYISESESYGIYLWLNCVGKTSAQCVQTFRNAGVTGIAPGDGFVGPGHVRIPMIHADSVFGKFLERLEVMINM